MSEQDDSKKEKRLNPEWKSRIRVTVLTLILFAVLGFTAVVMYRITGEATTVEEVEKARQSLVPAKILTE